MSQNGTSGSSSSPNKQLPKNMAHIVESVFRQGDSKVSNTDAEEWLRQLPTEQQRVVEEGIEAILRGGMGLAVERSFDTLVRQRQTNEKDKAKHQMTLDIMEAKRGIMIW